MNRWGKIPPNKIAVEQMDSAAAFEQQEKVKILKKNVWLRGFQSI